MTIESIRTRIAERGFMGHERELLAMLDEAVGLLRNVNIAYWVTDEGDPSLLKAMRTISAFLSTSAEEQPNE